MNNATTIALSRLMAQERAMDVTAGNIANANTPGYKAERVLFSEWLARQQNTQSPPGDSTIAYTQDRATWREQRDGPLSHTGNPLDIAITGTGFFTVDTARGPRLTRAGRFGLMPDGSIANSAGEKLLDTQGIPLQVSVTDTSISIAGDGTISSENGRIGKIGVVAPADPMRLQAEGGTLLKADTPTQQVEQPRLVQGAVEDSNVQPILEVTRMINDSRQFEIVSQFVQAEADRQQGAIDKILQPRS